MIERHVVSRRACVAAAAGAGVPATAARRRRRRARPATSRRPRCGSRRGRRPGRRATVAEGERVAAGDARSRDSTRPTSSSRSGAPRPSATRRRRSCAWSQAGARAEDIRQAAGAGRVGATRTSRAAQAELDAARPTCSASRRCSQANAGSRKQRDDAATRREVAAARVSGGARARARGRRRQSPGCKAGARPRGDRRGARARVAVGRRADRHRSRRTLADATSTRRSPAS